VSRSPNRRGSRLLRRRTMARQPQQNETARAGRPQIFRVEGQSKPARQKNIAATPLLFCPVRTSHRKTTKMGFPAGARLLRLVSINRSTARPTLRREKSGWGARQKNRSAQHGGISDRFLLGFRLFNVLSSKGGGHAMDGTEGGAGNRERPSLRSRSPPNAPHTRTFGTT